MRTSSDFVFKHVQRLAIAVAVVMSAAASASAQPPAPTVINSRGYINHSSLAIHTSSPVDTRGASVLVAFVSTHPMWNAMPVSITSLTDNAGNDWHLLTGPTTFVGNTYTLQSAIYYTNAPVTSSAQVLTAALTNPAPLVLHVFAVAGADVSATPLHSPITDPGAGMATFDVTGAPIAAGLNSLLLGWVKNDTPAGAVPGSFSGYTLDAQSSSFLWAETQQSSAGGLFQSRFWYDQLTGWQTALVGLQAAPGPAALGQNVSLGHDTSAGLTLTATSYSGMPIAYSVLAGPSHGTLSGTAPDLTYTPDAAYIGADAITFSASDPTGAGNPATISLAVRGDNRAPVANAGYASVLGGSGSLTLTGSDADGDPLTFAIVNPPAHGSLSAGTGGARVYTASPGYIGPDSFTFIVNDGHEDSEPAVVDVGVQAVAQVPTVISSRGYRQELPQGVHTTAPFSTTGASTLVAFVSTHPLWDGESVAIDSISDDVGNAWQMLTGPTVFTADAFTLMSAVFYVHAPITSGTHTVTVTLTNAAPLVLHVFAVAGTDINSQPLYSPITDPGAGWVDSNVSSSPISVPTNTLLLSWVKNDWLATAEASTGSGYTLDGESSSFLWAESQPAAAAGSYAGRFQYDAPIGWQTAIVGLTAPGGPLAYGQSLTTYSNMTVSVSLIGSSINPLTYQIVTPPSHGGLSGSGANRSYTPALNFVGTDWFSFKTNDGLLDSNVAIVAISIAPGAISPMIMLQPANQTVNPGAAAAFSVTAAGGPAPTVSWQMFDRALGIWTVVADNAIFSGSATPTLVVTADAAWQLSGAQFRAVATNGGGSVTSAPATLQTIPTAAGTDFDGDHADDVTAYRPSTGQWLVLTSRSSFGQWTALTWGIPGDIPVAGDYDGDGKADEAVYRPSNGTWYILKSTTNYSSWMVTKWGEAGDVPVPGDYDGDHRTDLVVYRPSNGYWYFLKSTVNYASWSVVNWGMPGDMPVPRDYDGDGKVDVALYRPSTGGWYLLSSRTNNATWQVYQWGTAGDLPVPADYDGDGKADLAIYRPSTGTWFVAKSSGNYGTWIVQQGGTGGDIPVPADYDGDGKTDIAVYRPANGYWYVVESRTWTWSVHNWGMPGDVPVAGY